MVKIIVGIVSSYRHYHHRQDCRTRWRWLVSSVSQRHYGEYDIAVQKHLKNTVSLRTPRHITSRTASWAKRVFLRNTRRHQSPPQPSLPPPHLYLTILLHSGDQNARKTVKEQSSYNPCLQFSGNKNTKLAYYVVKWWCCCSKELCVSGS